MGSFLINKTIMSATSQNQINLTISETQNHIEKIFPKSAIKICSFLQLFCAFTACLVQILLWSFTEKGFWSDGGVGFYFSIFFGAAGGIGLLAVHRPNYCTIIAFMVTSIIAT